MKRRVSEGQDLMNFSAEPLSRDKSLGRDVSIILPTYNERDNILDLVNRIIRTLEGSVNYELIIVDDDSPDGTAEAVKRELAARENIQLHVRNNERGLATAVRKGIELSSGSVIVVMDTDFNHDPKYIPQFLNLMQFYDVVVGSRFLYGGGMYSRWRYYASMLYNGFIRIFLGIPITDKLSGFFAMRRESLQEIDCDRIFYGYGDYFIRFLATVVNLKLRILEIPVFYDNRRSGETKTKFLKEFLRYTASVMKIRFGWKPASRRESPDSRKRAG
jgi:dolichol-phosphate mannosyltransferase